jgi:hypothetical protein
MLWLELGEETADVGFVQAGHDLGLALMEDHAYLSLKSKDVEEAESVLDKEMKVGIEEDSFDVVFFSVRRFCSVQCRWFGFGLEFVSLHVG